MPLAPPGIAPKYFHAIRSRRNHVMIKNAGLAGATPVSALGHVLVDQAFIFTVTPSKFNAASR